MNEQSASNIDIFNQAVGILFGKLYEKFPERINLDLNELAFELFDGDQIGEALYMETHVLLSETIRWLDQAGYIWTGLINKWEANEVVLSPKGLEVLKVVQDSSQQKSIGESLSIVLKSGAKEAAKTAIQGLVSIALTEGYKIFRQ
jgi:hypothetical protein